MGDDQANSRQTYPDKANTKVAQQTKGNKKGGKSGIGAREEFTARSKELNTNRIGGGSRFASLANLDDMEGDNREESDRAEEEARKMAVDLKGKNKVVDREDLMEGVEVNASDPSLLQGIRIIQTR